MTNKEILKTMSVEVSGNDGKFYFANSSSDSSISTNFNTGMLLDLNSCDELPLVTRVYEKRYSFSIRNINLDNNPEEASTSTDINFVKSEQKKQALTKKFSNDLICVTDGSSTSFKSLDSTNKAELNSVVINDHSNMNKQSPIPKNPSIFSKYILSDHQNLEKITTKYV